MSYIHYVGETAQEHHFTAVITEENDEQMFSNIDLPHFIIHKVLFQPKTNIRIAVYLLVGAQTVKIEVAIVKTSV